MKKLLYHIIFLLCLMIQESCQSQGPNDNREQEEISSRSLRRAAFRSKSYYIIYCSSNNEEEEKIKSILNKINNRSERIQYIIKNEEEVNAEILENNPILLIGEHQKFKCLQKIAPQLPIILKEQSFEFAGKIYNDSSSVLFLSYYPNPLNKNLPVSIITANNADVLINMFAEDDKELLFGRWGYEIFKEGKRIAMGDFDERNPNSKIIWKVDDKNSFEYPNKAKTIQQDENFTFYSNLNENSNKQLTEIIKEVKKAASTFDSLFELPTTLKIHYEFFENGEQKGMMTGNTLPAHINFKNAKVFATISQDLEGYKEHPEVNLLAKKSLGNTNLSIIETGLPIYFADNWKQKGYLYWFEKLIKTKNDFTIQNLLNNSVFQQNSELIKKCVGAAFVSFVIDNYGKERFTQIYKNGISESDIDKLSKDWEDYKKKLTSNLSSQAKTKSLSEDFYWKGFNFTHEGYRIYNGYLSEHAALSLEKLKSLNSNSIAVIPYSFMRNPNQPEPFRIPHNGGGETDESVFHTIYQAKQKGLKVLLKPQIWVGRNSWPGEIELKSNADWDLFFDYYYQWIRHYALIAEMYHADALCLGVELSKTTLKHPKKWEAMISEIRKIYSGKLTYSANWGEEFEKVKFWDAFDYIGISCYYPLSKSTEPDEKELIKGFKQNLKKLKTVSDKFDKPILLTEIGFRSIESPWVQPHDYPGEQQASEMAQQKCYDVVFDCLKNEKWCKGLFWWKWPTTFENSHSDDRDFSPHNKAAEKTVKKWYSEL
ncbi:glycoside hydrolase family 113 [Chondrinema litorale]|uniref:glycoside hydrolase family 113 n=1 Tax=Chondrinema litorale TaxID=2994555 RepID=UPI0025433EC3|nr:hypothetical protein [Chondrinema litorale]UZR93619.1 hypothetical protein OQ292_17355 [Chondrinema litorale]